MKPVSEFHKVFVDDDIAATFAILRVAIKSAQQMSEDYPNQMVYVMEYVKTKCVSITTYKRGEQISHQEF